MIIGTRGSELAIAQTKIVVGLLQARHPELGVEILKIKTTGDKVTDRPLSALGGFGAFVKELDQKIVAGEIDMAVNSLKDMPVDLTPGTELAAVLPRGPVEDVLLSRHPLEELPPGSVVGSSSVRRSSMIRAERPDLVLKDLRGNVPTRIKKWKAGEYDAIILARAGMVRLGIEEEGFVLDPRKFIPAVGQGAIVIVCKQGSPFLRQLSSLNDPVTRMEIDAERHILRALGGGCSVPIGVWAKREAGGLRVRGTVIGEGVDPLSIDLLLPIDGLEEGLGKAADILRSGLGGAGCGR